MTATREASASARSGQLVEPTEPRQARDGHDDVAPSTTKLVRNEVRDEQRCEECAEHHRCHRQGVEDTHDPAEDVGRHDAGERRFGDHLAGDHCRTADDADDHRDPRPRSSA